ncbi:tyrosine-type recombinase/integrase [Lichenihabitans psoromatis]|uniref:tyrosine-type recombinase/integrase n=1 Tax=Lichenihabitans psoromatis TaxID=2528642 RepID=UPI0013F1777B|nr:tyrosine-type recombinase/integrase [Lichenihabitans psoromatis]
MPRPFEHKNGTFYLNVRMPVDLPPRVKGAVVMLTVGAATVTTAVTDKVFCSLRTKDPALAKERFTRAYGDLMRQLAGMRAGPKALTHKEIVALAGEVYRDRSEHFDSDPHMVPDGINGARATFKQMVAALHEGLGDPTCEDSEGQSIYLATASFPNGPQVLAWKLQQDIDYLGVSMTLEQAMEDLFGWRADRICAEKGVLVDGVTRRKLLDQIGQSYRLLIGKLGRNSDGDYSPDVNLSRFPPFAAPPSQVPGLTGCETIAGLFERWKAEYADKRAPSTIRRYGPSVASLNKFVKGRDIRAVTQDDMHDWAKHRRDVEGIGAGTVNGNDLVAAATLFSWAMTRDGGRLRLDNPVVGVKLELPKRQTIRERTFRPDEIRTILLAARAVNRDPRYPKASASRRWTPWICAYTGARIQEVCWLSKEDIWCQAGIWVMRFPQTKDGFARVVPVHSELEREGLIRFVESSGSGLLFVGDVAQKPGASRSPQELRAAELAAWIRTQADLEPGLSPNHSWRHTFVTRAEGAGISKRHSNAITGHNKRRDASDGYFSPGVAQLKTEIEKLPAFGLA